MNNISYNKRIRRVSVSTTRNELDRALHEQAFYAIPIGHIYFTLEEAEALAQEILSVCQNARENS